MAAITRLYICIYNGVTRMVDAKDPGAVVRHVVGAADTELRPARAGEVAAWAREKKEIEIAGVAPLIVSGDAVAKAAFTVEDALRWFGDRLAVEEGVLLTPAQNRAVEAFRSAASEGRMTLMHFDEMREAVPDFGQAVLNGIASDGTMAGVRSAIEEEPVLFIEVVDIIADQKRREKFEPDQSEADRTGESLG